MFITNLHPRPDQPTRGMSNAQLFGEIKAVLGIRKAEVRGTMGIPAAAFVIGSVDRLVPVKGYDRLIAAFAGLCRSQTTDNSLPCIVPPVGTTRGPQTADQGGDLTTKDAKNTKGEYIGRNDSMDTQDGQDGGEETTDYGLRTTDGGRDFTTKGTKSTKEVAKEGRGGNVLRAERLLSGIQSAGGGPNNQQPITALQVSSFYSLAIDRNG